MKSIRIERPCMRMSMPVLAEERSTMTRPSPALPRRKSTSRMFWRTAPGGASANTAATAAWPGRSVADGRGADRHLRAVDRDDEELAVDRGGVGEAAREVHHEPGAVGRLHHRDALQVAFAGLDLRLGKRAGRVGKVDRDARGIGDGEALGKRGQRLLHAHLDQDLAALDRGEADRFDHILCRALGPGERSGKREHERHEGGRKRAESSDAEEIGSHFLSPLPVSSRSGSTLCRSAQSPALSWTISLSLISASVMSVMRPKFCPM